MNRSVAITVDVEQDCPPFLSTFRGMEEGMPKLLDLLAKKRVPATFFCTGEMARRFPDIIRRIVNEGHELGCHGDQHRNFKELSSASAQKEIQDSTRVLREFYPVRSFRAPYLRFPNEYLEYLREEGFSTDSSVPKYRSLSHKIFRENGLTRIPVSIWSSATRYPKWIRNPMYRLFRDPVVLFVHPWEFVDFRRAKLRRDCRFKTGEIALTCLDETIEHFRSRNRTFVPIHEMADSSPRE